MPLSDIPWWTVFWWFLAAGGLFIALIIARAVQMHFELKRQLKAAGVQFAERKKKTDA
jgi:hypothetical protein